MKRPLSRSARRRLRFCRLEARTLLAVGNDFYELKSDGDLYADDFFVSTADPVLPTVDATGRHLFDFSVNRPGDQTADITFAESFEPDTRIKIDSTKSYQFAFLGYEGEGAFVVEAFSSAGQSLGQISVPYVLPALEGLNFFRYANVHAMIGPGGQSLPAQTAWIDLVSPPQSPYTRFGFVEDYAFSFQSYRSVDQLKSPVTLGIDPSQSITLSAKAINHSSVVTTEQTHSLGYVGLDAERLVIEPIHTQKYGSSADARLASELKPGDTTITLTTTEGWSNTSYDPSTRALAWYGYGDSLGTQYADFSYTRNVARDASEGMWSRGGISGNRITLNKPWAGPLLLAGTAMRNAIDGESLVAALLDHAPLVSTMGVTLHGEWTDGSPVAGQFAPATKYIQLAATTNQSSVRTDERVSVRMQFDRNPTVSIISPQDNSRAVTFDVLSNDGSKATTILGVTPGKLGTVEIVAGGRQLIYRPQAFFIGTDAFTYDSVDNSGNRVTHQVQIKSLGGNLDSDTSLRIAVETAALAPTPYTPNVEMRHSFVGVKDQTLDSSLFGNWTPQLHAHRLDEIGFQAGSLSLQANGDFKYQPVSSEANQFPFLSTASNGSDQQPAINVITIAESEFRRDQVRLADIGFSIEDLSDGRRRNFYPVGLPLDTNGRPFLSWRVHLLPCLGYQELYGRFKQDEPWNSVNNLPLLAEMPDIFRSRNDGPSVTSTRYQAIASSTYPSPYQLLLNNADGRGDLLRTSLVTDGIESTLLVVQAGADKAVPWTQNVDLPYDVGNPLATLGNVGAYFNAYFAGQQLRALPTDIGPSVFQALVTATQGDFADPAALTRQALTRTDFPGDGHSPNARTQEEQMQDLLLGMHGYESTFSRFAPSTSAAANTFSWRVWLLPYIGQSTLFNQFNFNETWDSPHNRAVATQMPDVYRSLGDDALSVTTRFRVLGGSNMAYGSADALRSGPRLSSFGDGTSNSILIVEAGTDKAVPWTMPEVLPVDVANFWASLGNLPGNELLLGMADGSTVRAASSTANELMIGLATINRGDSNRAAFQAAQLELLPSTPMQTSNNLKMVGLAARNFESAYRFLPNNFTDRPSTLPTAANVGLSWRVAILPFIEELPLYNRFHLNEPWDSPHNLSLLPFMPAVFKNGADIKGDYTTRLQRFSGTNTLDPKQKITLSQITDGTSNTIFAGIMASEKAVPWTKPDDIDFISGDDWSVVGNTEFMPIVLANDDVTSLRKDQDLGLYNLPFTGSQTFEQLVTRNDGVAEAGRTRTVVMAEDAIFAFDVKSSRPLLLEFEVPGIAQAASRADGYLTDYGALQRITVGATTDLNGKRQTKLFVKALSSNPDLPPEVIETIDVIIVDSDQAPRLNPISDIVISEDSINATLKLDGISSGNCQSQAVALSARSLSSSLIAPVSIDYQPGSSTAMLSMTPVADQSGTGIIEVTVTNAGADGDLLTTSDNGVLQRTFTVTVQAVNDAPTIGGVTDVVVPEDSVTQQSTITGIGAGPSETQPLRVTASTDSLLVTLNSTNLILTGTSATIRWTPVADRFGQAVILVQVEDGGLDGDLATASDNAITTAPLTITLTPKNDAPTIDRPANQLILEDAFVLVVPLENIGAGPYEAGDVLVTASVGNGLLLQELTLQRLPGSTQGSLLIKPMPNQSGATMVSLRVEDGGADNDLLTTVDNLVTFTAFELVIQPVNDAPELDSIANLVVDVSATDIAVPLTGINAGSGGEVQPLRITATTDAIHLIPDVQVGTITGSTATLKFSTIGMTPGLGTIRVVVEDSGLDGDLATPADNLTITREFLVTVNVPPVVSDDRFRTLKNNSSILHVLDNDVDLGDTLTVVVTQAPPVEQATIHVNTDGTLLFTPASGFTGVVNFAYRVVDQHGRDSGIANVIVGIGNAKYQNPFSSLDVNGDGQITPLDALLIINTLNDPNQPKQEADYAGSNDLDTSGDGVFSAIDALLVINKLNGQ